MTLAKGAQTYQIKALTDLWTGSVNGKPDRLINTGLIGSIRWWFEVLVRGLDGYACDPTEEKSRCPDKDGRRCVVCELFGCTGWARKFRFEVLDKKGKIKKHQIKRGDKFQFRFTELRPIKKKEWALLDATLRLIADYGAMGGKTVFKPSIESAIANVALTEIDNSLKIKKNTFGSPLRKDDQIIELDAQKIQNKNELEKLMQGKKVGEPIRIKIERKTNEETIDGWIGKKHHQGYGLVGMTHSRQFAGTARDDLETYLSEWPKINHGEFAWASLQHFWCVNGKYLGRQDNNKSTFNQVTGRPEPKQQSGQNDSWIAGRRPDPKNKIKAESKKVFSFKDPARTFGFVKPGLIDFDAIKKKLQKVWAENDWELMTGEKIIGQLFADKEDHS